MKFRRLPTRLQETLQNMGSTVQNGRRAGDAKEATQCGKAVLKKRQLFKSDGGYLMRGRVWLSLNELLGNVEAERQGC